MSDKILPIPFNLTGIEEFQYSVFEEALNSDAEPVQNVSLGFGTDAANRIIGSTVLYQIKKGEQPLLQIETACFFEIEEQAFKENLLAKGQIILPQPFAAHLAAISVGTARGILFAKTKGTPFNEYYLNLTNVEAIITDDIVLDIENE